MRTAIGRYNPNVTHSALCEKIIRRKSMNECSIIARRQGDASIVCSWLRDDGSTICEMGEFLNQYQTSEDTKRLFSLQKYEDEKKTDNGKSKCAGSAMLPVDQDCWGLESENDIFDLYPVQHCFFYEWDQNWYYIFRGPGNLLFKTPLQLINNNTGQITEDEYLQKIQIDVLTAILMQEVHEDPCLRLYLLVYEGEYDELIKEIKGSRSQKELELFYQKLNRVYASYGRWIVIDPDPEYRNIRRIFAVEEYTGVHIETCLW